MLGGMGFKDEHVRGYGFLKLLVFNVQYSCCIGTISMEKAINCYFRIMTCDFSDF